MIPMKKFLTLFLFTIACISVFAQDSLVAVSENKHVHFDVALGYMKTDLRSINTTLDQFGYRPINENMMTLSFSSGYIINRFLIRNEVNIMLPNSVDQGNNITTYFKGYSVGFGVGYAVIDKPTFRLYPFVNLIAFANRLEIEDSSPINAMNDVMTGPHRSATLYFSNASFDLGLQAERLINLKTRKWDCPQNHRFMTFGIRAGYAFGPGEVKARYNGIKTIADGPNYSVKGPYVKLVMGLGATMRDLKWKK